MFDIGSRVWPGISKLIEECAEIIQVCGKLIALRGERRHWDGTDLKARLEDEIADGYAAGQFVIEHCDLDTGRIAQRAREKIALFEKWHDEHREAA
jgi:hypothetical protein